MSKILKLRYVGPFQLQLQLVRNQGNELRIGGFSLGIAHRIAKEALQSIQVSPVPCYLNGMADGAFHPAGRGLECLRHLGVQYLCNGVGVPYGPPGSLLDALFETYK